MKSAASSLSSGARSRSHCSTSIAERVQRRLGKTPSELPLAAVLEGGTWHAGRKIAGKSGPDGAPPLKVASDGTVF